MKVEEFFKHNMDGEYVKSYMCVLNPEDNGGESVTFEVDAFLNGDGQVYTNIHLKCQCYGASVTQMSFYGGAADVDGLGEACAKISHLLKGLTV